MRSSTRYRQQHECGPARSHLRVLVRGLRDIRTRSNSCQHMTLAEGYERRKIGGGVTHKVVLGSLRELLLGGMSQVRVFESRSQVSRSPGDGMETKLRVKGGCYSPGDSELVKTELISGADAPSMMAACGSGATRERKYQARRWRGVRRRREGLLIKVGRECCWLHVEENNELARFCLTSPCVSACWN